MHPAFCHLGISVILTSRGAHYETLKQTFGFCLNTCGQEPSRLGANSEYRGGASRAQFPDNPEKAEDPQHVIREVNLPPPLTLSCAAHKLMMIVVPTLSERDQRQHEVVTALVFGFHGTGAPNIDRLQSE